MIGWLGQPVWLRQCRARYFKQFEPVDMIGYSIYIYHITPEEANRARREMGLSEIEETEGEQ